MGFLVVDKPVGWTSHDVVDAARRWLGTRRVGHLGTLDPLATGVLPLAVREATKLVPYMASAAKAYRATLRLGLETDTHDSEGKPVRAHAGPLPDEASVRGALAGFAGEILQTPPMFSAIKRAGVPLYVLARRGESVERAPRRVTIERLALVRFDPPELEIELACSAGTYVRSLAHDLGRALGCGAVVAALRRTQSGPFVLSQAVSADALTRAADEGGIAALLVPPAAGLGLPAHRLDAPSCERIVHGADVALGAGAPPVGARVLLLDMDGRALAVAELRPGRIARPLRVLRGPAGAD
jgi:tRNA pseudouridine55 synthase